MNHVAFNKTILERSFSVKNIFFLTLSAGNSGNKNKIATQDRQDFFF